MLRGAHHIQRGPVFYAGLRTDFMTSVRGGATVFRQCSGGNISLLISFTACSPNFSGGNNIVLPPQIHLSGGKLPPLPYGGAAQDFCVGSDAFEAVLALRRGPKTPRGRPAAFLA